MLSLPSPPPSPLPTEAAPPPEKRSFPVSLNQIVISKQARNPQKSSAETSNSESKKLSKPPIFKHPRPRRTNLVIWCGAILCLIFSLVLIVFGIATLIIYLVVKPRNPVFDMPNANLNSIYFDSPEYFNGDLTFLANFSNPNQKLDVRFEHVDIELYFSDRLVGTQALQPFTQRSRETRLESVHIISSLVYLPQNLAVELQKQVQSNKVNYNIRGTFKVRANMGLLHYSYWLHGRCEIEMTGPPTGVIVARSCRTKR
ncbi:protein YLS [Salix suchowensis]|nr:protein YLS [Salix suchowensis]